MSFPLLTTKLYIPPVRLRLVSRPHLIAGLNAGRHRKLTLVSAPAGFGKTTLLGEWAQHVGQPVAWLSLDEDDNDPNRFWRYLIAALQTVEPALGEMVLGALESPQPPLEALATALINEIAAVPGAFYILVLDDYHVIKTERIHQSLDFLLDHLPPQLHVVIATREDPPLSLARRRGRAEITELRVVDLRFTTQDAAEFLNTIMDLDLSVEEVAALEDRTEGWAVGLQMAALALRDARPLQGQSDKRAFIAAFAGDDRYIGDYLVEEVLQRQPAHVQAFLLQTSILERLCGPLCDAVTRGTDGQAILDSLEQANLFIVPLDNRRHWYRYHQLFANLLRHRLRQSTEAPHVATLHRRASEWHEREGLVAEAVSHALASSDLGYATALVERHAPDVASRGENVLAGSWLEALPEDRIRSSPLLCLLQASYAESIERKERWLQDAEKAWTEQAHPPDADPVARVRFAGWMTASRVSLLLRRGASPQEVIAAAHQALDRIPEDDLVYNLRARSNILMALGHAHWRLGDEETADRALAEARSIADAIEHFSISISATCDQARIAYSRGRLHQAAAICQEALRSIVEPAEEAGRPLPAAGRLYIVLGTILLEWSDLEGAERALTRGLKLIELTQARSFQKDGYLALARLRQAQGDADRALSALQRALALAEPEGHVHMFVDEGAPMAQLLYEAAARGIAPNYVDEFLATFPVSGGENGSPPPRPHAPPLIEPLSGREREVLQLVAEGLSNRQIAQRLFISPNTVRVHTSNIYRKLDVHSRTEALARARNLGLL